MVAVTVLSMAIFGITAPFAIAAASQAEDARRTLANALAQEMMEEILAKSHEAADAAATGPGRRVRAEFESIHEYAVLDEPAGRIEDAFGHVIRDPAATGLSRHTRVHNVSVGGQTSLETSFVRVDVELRYRGKHVLTVTRLVYCDSARE